MRKIFQYFKSVISMLLKIIVATMMGIGLSLGNKRIEPEKKNDKTIESN